MDGLQIVFTLVAVVSIVHITVWMYFVNPEVEEEFND